MATSKKKGKASKKAKPKTDVPAKFVGKSSNKIRCYDSDGKGGASGKRVVRAIVVKDNGDFQSVLKIDRSNEGNITKVTAYEPTDANLEAARNHGQPKGKGVEVPAVRFAHMGPKS